VLPDMNHDVPDRPRGESLCLAIASMTAAIVMKLSRDLAIGTILMEIF
jgi:hypothetical protein